MRRAEANVPPPPPMGDVLLRMRHIAQQSSFSVTTLHQMRRDPRMRFPEPIRINGAVCYSGKAVAEWIEFLKVHGQQASA